MPGCTTASPSTPRDPQPPGRRQHCAIARAPDRRQPLRHVRAFDPTVLVAFPAAYELITAFPSERVGDDLRGLRLLLSSAARCPPPPPRTSSRSRDRSATTTALPRSDRSRSAPKTTTSRTRWAPATRCCGRVAGDRRRYEGHPRTNRIDGEPSTSTTPANLSARSPRRLPRPPTPAS